MSRMYRLSTPGRSTDDVCREMSEDEDEEELVKVKSLDKKKGKGKGRAEE